MRLFDPKFKEHIANYIIQCLLAMLVIGAVSFMDDAIVNMTVVASLGASTFIALTMPHTNASKPRYLIGGYIIGAVFGIILHSVNARFISAGFMFFGRSPHIISCAIAVGFTMFVMVLTNFEHPPAAALSMGLVMQQNAAVTALIAVASIIVVSVIKTVFKKRLKNLL